MAKTKEPKALKKGKASFNLIGRVKRTDKSFNLNNTYDSGWTDNSMYIGVDCGNGNVVYSEMRSGFFPDNESTIRAYSKDDKDDNENTHKGTYVVKTYSFLFPLVMDSNILVFGKKMIYFQ